MRIARSLSNALFGSSCWLGGTSSGGIISVSASNEARGTNAPAHSPQRHSAGRRAVGLQSIERLQ